jgi:hypothetical protein
MADVAVTANEVLPDSGTQVFQGTLGGTVTAGQAVYRNASGQILAADANASAAASAVIGIALTGGVSGQSVLVADGLRPGGCTLDPGFTVGVGTPYFLSATAGGICPAADLATGMYPALLGFGVTASQLKLQIVRPGVAIP